MKPSRRFFLLALLGLLAAAGAGSIYLYFARAGPPLDDPRALFPPRVSLAAHLFDLEGAVARHWRSRGRDDASAGLREALELMGLWEAWVANHGETGAALRLAAYEDAVYRLAGADAWLVFGEWPGAPGEPPQVALMAFVRESLTLRATARPLARLLIADHQLRESVYRGADVIEYAAGHPRDSVAVTRLGGWLCVSLRGGGRAALERAIDQYHASLEAGSDASVAAAATEATTGAAIELDYRPQAFFEHLDRFAVQRGREISDRAARDRVKWTERLAGIERITLRQSGESLLNLDGAIEGDFVASLPAPPLDLVELEVADAPGPRAARDDAGPAILQAEFSSDFARAALPRFGVEWDKVLEDLEGARLLAARARGRLTEALAPADGGAVRLGLALYPSTPAPLPGLAVWTDAEPFFHASDPPARAWPSRARSAIERDGDVFVLSRLAMADRRTTPPLASERADLADAVWRSESRSPEAWIAVDWPSVAEAMDAFPLLLISSDKRPGWAKRRRFVDLLRLATGGIALRVDREAGVLRVRVRTLEVRSPRPAP